MDKAQIIDLMAIVVAIVAVVITVLAVFVAFLLSKNYLQSVRELQELNGKTSDLDARITALVNAHTSELREGSLALRSIFDLMMTIERRTSFEALRSKLLEQRVWKQRALSDREVSEYSNRVLLEIERANREIQARQSEVYWLVGQSTEKASHLHALQTTHGDSKSIQLLEKMREIQPDVAQRDALLVTVTRLRERLGRPSPKPTPWYARSR